MSLWRTATVSGARTSALAASGKRGVQNHSTMGETKMPLRAAAGPASSLHYSLLLRVAENPRRSHSYMSFPDAARSPRGKKTLHIELSSASPREQSHVGWAVARGSGLLPSK